MNVVDIAIRCTDEQNYSDAVEEALLDARGRIPNSYGFLRDQIDKLVETQGAQYKS
ncbi:hypothetical protein [Octadecabacter antarcticus]|uniref:hypothetical protein n=1 Tax=Octadecabacter antarcticus TaxID=1217908 RepID=UPI0016514B20|nr:hypothetical protein [Octadecabacter antarcticus]